MVTCNKNVFLGLSIAGLVIIIVVAIVGFVAYPIILDDQIAQQVELREGTEQFDRFQELPITVDFKVYMFNVINPENVTFGFARPIVEEIGPYVYRQYRHKENLSYDPMDDTWMYVQYQHFEFDAEASYPLSENDRIMTINSGLNALFQMAQDILSPLLLNLLVNGAWSEIFPDTVTMFHEVRVGELLFDGHKFCAPGMSLIPRIICEIIAATDIKLMERQEDGSIDFSFFAYKQDQHDGIHTVDAGMQNPKALGLIRQWEGYAYQDVWNGRMSRCNKVTGRDSTIYPPYMEEEDTLDIFSTDICRTINIEYAQDDEVKGIAGQKRVLAAATLLAPENNPDNACYCDEQTKNLYGQNECLPDGFIPIQQCVGAPVIASLPHLMGVENNASLVEGLRPNPDLHTTYVIVEPQTGTPLEGRKRLQFNMVLRPIEGIEITNNLTYSLIPIMWVEEGVTITDALADEVQSRFLTVILAVEIVIWLLIGQGILMFVLFGGYYVYRVRRPVVSA